METAIELVQFCEATRIRAGKVDRTVKSAKGQFLTPLATADYMASLFLPNPPPDIRILDPGAGTGVLFAALLNKLCSFSDSPRSVSIVAYENDLKMIPHLFQTMGLCEKLCEKKRIRFHGEIRQEDFILDALDGLHADLFHRKSEPFTHVILNPPYKKINNHTVWRRKLDAAGMPVSNLYAAFVWIAMELLDKQGELAAITPRSFCNGPYFQNFRQALVETCALDRFHLFRSRKSAFSEDGVLQENVIFHGVKGAKGRNSVVISSSDGLDFENADASAVPYWQVVAPGEPECVIHLPENKFAHATIGQTEELFTTLEDLDVEISTGRVVDFRAKEFLMQNPSRNSVPLIYPCHFSEGGICWPLESRKPNALLDAEETRKLLVPKGVYLLLKRFSAKEERRRIVAALCDSTSLPGDFWGFENHLNYFHREGKGLDSETAKGLFVYLNSTFFDRYFRLFSGHTQVNATDLRRIKYPTRDQLCRMGKKIDRLNLSQKEIDALLQKECRLHAREE